MLISVLEAISFKLPSELRKSENNEIKPVFLTEREETQT